MLYLIPIIIIALSVIGLAVIVFRRFSDLRLVDVLTHAKNREAKIKERILVERMRRTVAEKSKIVRAGALDWAKFLQKRFSKVYQKILELEKYYKEAAISKKTALKKIDKKRVNQLLKEAEGLLKEEKYGEAEKKYIEAVELNPREPRAFKGLGNLYIKQKQLEHAEETFKFLLKINPDDTSAYLALGQIAFAKGDKKGAERFYSESIARDASNVNGYIGLGTVYKSLGEEELALEQFRKAVKIEPNNPRYLDYLIEASIITGQRVLAKSAYKKLKEVNPENQKLEELESKIKKIPV